MARGNRVNVGFWFTNINNGHIRVKAGAGDEAGLAEGGDEEVGGKRRGVFGGLRAGEKRGDFLATPDSDWPMSML